MKIKIALLGLFFANSIIHPIYADQCGFQLEEDQVDEKAEEAAEKKDDSKNLIKLGTTVTMSPAFVYQDQTWSTKNSLSGQLTFNADVPKAWCNKDATVKIDAKWDGDTFKVNNSTVTIGKMVTMGYTSSIFGYEKADPAWFISADATVLQIKYEYTFDWFRMGCAIERPVALRVGLFDKNKSGLEKKGDKEEDTKNQSIQLDNLTDKELSFKIKNSIPAVGLNLSVVTDRCNIGLSGLLRYTDYTHSTNSKEKKLQRIYYTTYGGNLGMQCQVVPKKFTVTAQGIYVYGLGDYVSGLSDIQNDKEREEMCAAYYIDKGNNALSSINAWGIGATLEYCATPKWTLSIRGSYLGTVEDAQKPVEAFRAQWGVIPRVAYAVNKYFTLSGRYSLVKECKVDKKKNKGREHKLSGSIKFSL